MPNNPPPWLVISSWACQYLPPRVTKMILVVVMTRKTTMTMIIFNETLSQKGDRASNFGSQMLWEGVGRKILEKNSQIQPLLFWSKDMTVITKDIYFWWRCILPMVCRDQHWPLLLLLLLIIGSAQQTDSHTRWEWRFRWKWRWWWLWWRWWWWLNDQTKNIGRTHLQSSGLEQS